MFKINIAPSPSQVAKMWPSKKNNIILSQIDLAWIKAGMANWDAYVSYKPKSS